MSKTKKTEPETRSFFNRVYTFDFKTLMLYSAMLLIVGAIIGIFAPVLIWTVAVGFFVYVAFTIYDAITNNKVKSAA